MTALAVALHNLPEGLAIGAGFTKDEVSEIRNKLFW